MRKKVIEFKNFSFQYDSQAEPTLHDINLDIYEGEKILIVGPSGSGKSTLAQCINGLIPNMFKGEIKGQALIDGKDLATSSISELSFSAGTVLQDMDSQFIGLTVAEDIAFALENDYVAQDTLKEEVAKWAQIVEVQELLEHSPQKLSGGQKQRVSMAGVLISTPPILLFDEPLANLDPKSGKETIDLIDQIHQNHKRTIVIIEHRLEDVLYRDVDRIILVNNGRILADLPPEELLKSDILQENGLREPLYVSALKYAGVDLSQVEHLARLDKITAPNIKESLENWANDLEKAPEEEKENLLHLEELTYQYAPKLPKVLEDVTTNVKKGQMISIVGKNGAGKSTFSKAVTGFIHPSGIMQWKGEDFATLSIKERAEKIGYVMQNPNRMISQKMIFDEVALGLRLRAVPEEEIRERVENTLKVTGLYPFRNWPIAALSYGQKKRVTIASILVLEPEMIILDEPTAGQDFKNYSEILKFLEELNALGKTILMITHDMHLMLEYSERTLVFLDGKIIADKTPVEVLTDSELVEKAYLKETSLYLFAQRFGLDDPLGFARKFIAYERKERSHG